MGREHEPVEGAIQHGVVPGDREGDRQEDGAHGVGEDCGLVVYMICGGHLKEDGPGMSKLLTGVYMIGE